MALKPKPRGRARVLVDLGDADGVLARALPDQVYRRGRRLRELALLGLAAEAAGLGLDYHPNGHPTLQGLSPPGATLAGTHLHGLPGSPERPLSLSATQDIVLPEGFIDQF